MPREFKWSRFGQVELMPIPPENYIQEVILKANVFSTLEQMLAHIDDAPEFIGRLIRLAAEKEVSNIPDEIRKLWADQEEGEPDTLEEMVSLAHMKLAQHAMAITGLFN